jgi:DNA-binding transcriptional regulator YiaG
MSEDRPKYGSEDRAPGWDGARVRSLRDHLGDTQRAFAERLGTRQQTVSEWETGASRPRTMACRLLHLVAEERGFYSVEREVASGGDAADGEREHG